jgi:drug/metabolite transporter superfamily protein YnfA
MEYQVTYYLWKFVQKLLSFEMLHIQEFEQVTKNRWNIALVSVSKRAYSILINLYEHFSGRIYAAHGKL